MRSIEQVKDQLAQERKFGTWHEMAVQYRASGNESSLDHAIGQAMSNYAFLTRLHLVKELKRTFAGQPESIRLIEETEYRTYPDEKH
jgi:hypothetical protein